MLKLKGAIEGIAAKETVIFTNRIDFEEYLLLTSEKNNIFPDDLTMDLPFIQSKYWSQSLCNLDKSGAKSLSINKSKLSRLITYNEWKDKRGIVKC